MTYAAGGVYNVLAYGAVGDGVADDTAEIQATIDAASAGGGGVVFLPKGTYKITAVLNMASYVTMRGVGNKSIIDWRGAQGVGAIQFSFNTDAGLENLQIQNLSTVCAGVAVDTVGGSERIHVRNVRIIGTTITVGISSISGNGTTVTVTTSAPHGLVTGDDVHIYGTSTLYDSQHSSITVTSTTTFTDGSANNLGSLSIGTVQKIMWSNGVVLRGADSVAEQCQISTGIYTATRILGSGLRNKLLNNYVSNVFRGVMCDNEEGAGARYNLIAGNHLHQCKSGACKIEATATHNIFSNNIITECSIDAYVGGTISVGGAYSTIENNNLFFTTTPGAAAIEALDTSSHVVIKGNTIQAHPGFGITLGSGVTYADILGNHITGGTRGINFGGSTTAYITVCNNRVTTVSAYGIFLGTVSGFVIQNNTIVGVTTNSGILLNSACLYGSITGNMIINCGQHGILVSSSGNPCKFVSITANIIYDTDNLAAANDHIALANQQQNITIVGNVLNDTGTGNSVVTGDNGVSLIVIGNSTSGGVNVGAGGTTSVANNY